MSIKENLKIVKYKFYGIRCEEEGEFIMSDEIAFSISIPTDEYGYVLLKCPLCGELFKLKPSDYEDDSVFEVYCPACGLVSDSYVTDDIIELGMAIAENYVNDLIMKEFKKLERQTKDSMIKFKVTNKSKRKSEQPIMLTIEALERKMYSCCKMEAKIKPILKMSGSYCPYCGVIDYGFE